MHTGNGIGAAALPGLRSEHSHSHSSQSQEKDYEKHAYPATDDVEAAPSTEVGEGEDLYEDDEPSKYAEKWNAFRASKTFTIIRDFLMIGLLVRFPVFNPS